MSADNWTICPECKKKNDELNKSRILDTAEKYGKIPSDEYITLAKETSKPIEIECAMREDYDIGVGDDGTFDVDYHCQCTECGFKYVYKYSEPAKNCK